MNCLFKNTVIVMGVITCLAVPTVFASEQSAVTLQSGKTVELSKDISSKQEVKANDQSTNVNENVNNAKKHEYYTDEKMM